MKIAITGKGGSGKTTISATLSRILARRGLPVIAIEGDPNPNLAQALGMNPNAELKFIPRTIVQRTETEEGAPKLVLTQPVSNIVAEYGAKAPDNVTVLSGVRIDHAGAG